MSDTKYDMSGFYSVNDKKTPDSNQPDFRGKCTINGKEYWISGWRNENDRGKYHNLKFQPVEEKASTGQSKFLSDDGDEDF